MCEHLTFLISLGEFSWPYLTRELWEPYCASSRIYMKYYSCTDITSNIHQVLLETLAFDGEAYSNPRRSLSWWIKSVKTRYNFRTNASNLAGKPFSKGPLQAADKANGQLTLRTRLDYPFFTSRVNCFCKTSHCSDLPAFRITGIHTLVFQDLSL